MSDEAFSRRAARPEFEKPFNLTSTQVSGHSNGEAYKKYSDYKDADAMRTACMLYAGSYSAIMLHRVEEEQPDFFENQSMTKDEFAAHLQNNICLNISKYRSAVFKNTTAKIQEEGYLNDKIRRLANGGDKFHPYL